MRENFDLLSLLCLKLNQLDEPDFCESVLSWEEECPYGEAAYSSIKNGITIYKEEFVSYQIPEDVHFRLHQVIRQRWSISHQDSENDE